MILSFVSPGLSISSAWRSGLVTENLTRRVGVEPFVITCRNNVITRGYWTRGEERSKLVDKQCPART